MVTKNEVKIEELKAKGAGGGGGDVIVPKVDGGADSLPTCDEAKSGHLAWFVDEGCCSDQPSLALCAQKANGEWMWGEWGQNGLDR